MTSLCGIRDRTPSPEPASTSTSRHATLPGDTRVTHRSAAHCTSTPNTHSTTPTRMRNKGWMVTSERRRLAIPPPLHACGLHRPIPQYKLRVAKQSPVHALIEANRLKNQPEPATRIKNQVLFFVINLFCTNQFLQNYFCLFHTILCLQIHLLGLPHGVDFIAPRVPTSQRRLHETDSQCASPTVSRHHRASSTVSHVEQTTSLCGLGPRPAATMPPSRQSQTSPQPARGL